MYKLKSVWTSISGSVSSIIPLLFACCKSGACIGVCASPITSLFGISTASFAASPLFGAIVPILIALSAVSFTVSYFSIYVIPKYKNCATECDCKPDANSLRKVKISKIIFWVGLLASIFFFTYFEIQKYQKESTPTKDCCVSQNTITDSLKMQVISDTAKACCSEGQSCE